jgi:hypothetical protein
MWCVASGNIDYPDLTDWDNPLSTCSSQSVAVSNLINTSPVAFDSSDTRGQTFQLPSDALIKSIGILVSEVTGGPITATLRLDNDDDMTTEYLSETTVVISTDGEYTFLFPQPVSALGLTQLRITMIIDQGTLNLARSVTDVYPNGTYWYHNALQVWAGLTELNTRDLWFKVNVCAE